MASKAMVVVPKSLAELGFEVPSTNVKKRVNALIAGKPKSGKTELGCSAPGPIAFLGGDDGTRGVVEKWGKRGKKIYLKEYPSIDRFKHGLRERKLAASEHTAIAKIWEAQQLDYNTALSCGDDEIRTIVVDGVSEWYVNARLANWSADSVGKFQFGPLNQFLANMMRAALNTNKNVLFLCKLAKEYTGGDDGKWTGEYKPSTFSGAQYCAENYVMLARDEDGEFTMEVQESRVNGKLFKGREDSKREGSADVNFTELAMMLYPGTDEDDWEDAE